MKLQHNDGGNVGFGNRRDEYVGCCRIQKVKIYIEIGDALEKIIDRRWVRESMGVD